MTKVLDNMHWSQADRIKSLMGTAAPDPDGESWDVAAHVIDGILDNEECNGPGTYSTWTAALAVEIYCDDQWDEGGVLDDIDPETIDFDAVEKGIAAALVRLVEEAEAEDEDEAA